MVSHSSVPVIYLIIGNLIFLLAAFVAVLSFVSLCPYLDRFFLINSHLRIV